jgi:hypothetical protein
MVALSAFQKDYSCDKCPCFSRILQNTHRIDSWLCWSFAPIKCEFRLAPALNFFFHTHTHTHTHTPHQHHRFQNKQGLRHMSVLLLTLLKTTGDSSCLLLVLRAFSVYRYCVAAASCLLSPSPKRRERPSLCPPLLPSRLRHHLIAQNPVPSDVDVYTPIPRKYSKTSHADTMSPPLSALPKSP